MTPDWIERVDWAVDELGLDEETVFGRAERE